MEAFYGILIPFLGTSLGAACVFFLRKTLSDAVQRALTGFAAGVMVAASVWSLLIPAIAQSAALGRWSFLPAALGFWAGILFLLALDHIIPHLHAKSGQAEGPKSRLQRTTMMVLAVTLHNIPEGMAVGVVYAGYLSGQRADHGGGRAGALARHCHPELPGGRDHLPAAARGGDEKGQRVSGRRALRRGGADRGGPHDPRGAA